MSLIAKIFGDQNEKSLKALAVLVPQVNALEHEFEKLTAEGLKEKTNQFKERLKQGLADGKAEKEILDALLPEAFAAVREASKRTLGQRHFDVQLVGGAILHQGKISEMRTGEGKTLVATLPAYLNALSGKGVHIVTVNDYLSRRDAVWMGQIYDALGLSVGVINHELSFLYDSTHIKSKEQEQKEDVERDQLGSFRVMHDFLRPVSRKQAYDADITYGTNNQFGFDYLYDNIEYSAHNLRQRPFNYAIVDEIDSILIDEARVPLIISAPYNRTEDLYTLFAKIADKLKAEEDYTVDEKFHAISLTDAGIEKAEKALGIENMYTEGGVKYVHHLETAIRAKALFHKDKEYVVKDNEVTIVDEFTGRLQPGRRWSEGLHQAIEAKEGVKIQQESRTYASITFQNYFRLYKKLSGMTGTAMTSKEEFLKVYGLDTIAVPTNKPIERIDGNDQIFQTEMGKFKAVARKIKELNSKGQPVLVGTVSIEKNELLSEILRREGVKHEMLNAKNHEREAEIIAQAGRRAAVTIATNMAGRGVDIKLGGIPAPAGAYEEVKSLGGLFVLGTERHEARRIDNQLRGRAGRQGDPGHTQFYVSMEDNLMRIFAPDIVKRMMGKLGVPEDQPIENSLITRALENAQTKIEGFNFDSRKQVLEYDDVLNLQRLTVYERRRKVLIGNQDDLEDIIEEIISEAGENAEKFKAVVEEKESLLGEKEFYASFGRLFLQTIDMFWVDHLEMMDYLRGSVRLRAYGQRDPLVEYKREGLRMFKEMEQAVRNEIVNILPKVAAGAFSGQVAESEQKKLEEAQKQMQMAGGEDQTKVIQRAAQSGQSHDQLSAKGGTEKVGRNDPCPCGSGKKFKKCHGK